MKKKIYFYSFFILIVDLLSKYFVSHYFADKICIIKNFFFIDFVKNTGGAFSIFSGYSYILAILALLVLLIINKYFLNENLNKLEFISFVLLIGGIFGNLFDRIINGYVIDFFSFNIFGYMFPIFNVADICICVGVFLFMIDIVRNGKK